MPLHLKQNQTFTMSVETYLCAISYAAKHVHKITENSKLLLEFPIRLHYMNLNQKVLLKVDTGSDINCISLGTF